MARRVLIITAGGTPQVVTETLYALAKPASGEASWWPDELVLMTTEYGARIYRQGEAARRVVPLLGPEGKLAELVAELGRPEPVVRVEVAPHPTSGKGIADIRSPEEVAAFADHLLAEVSRQTAADSEVHLSLAGGRKTMSYVAGAVLSLYGRAEDRLSHVLIEPDTLEFVPEFWWPEQLNPSGGPGRDGKPWTAAGARALLHTVPFVRLRAHLDVDKVFGPDPSFADAVGSANAALSADLLRIDTPTMSISAGGAVVTLKEPAQLAMYRLLAQAQKEGWSVGGGGRGTIRLDLLPRARLRSGRRVLDLLGEIHKDVWMRGMKVDQDRAGYERDDFMSLAIRSKNKAEPAKPPTADQIKRAYANRRRSQLSDVRTAIAGVFPEELIDKVAPQSLKHRNMRGYWLIPWNPDRIEIT